MLDVTLKQGFAEFETDSSGPTASTALRKICLTVLWLVSQQL
jgi:hypothetical protein